ncbi:MAG TPA: metallophosphoesterase family protein [bacterium]|nr:metallophosphoesterase family protein [bacterium]
MIAIIADIHGNLPALEASLRAIKTLGCDTTVSLGDVAGYYCFINECVELLADEKITNIMGNHDLYITEGSKCPRSRSANICLDYQRGVLKSENLEWLKNSSDEHSFEGMNMVHGGWNDPVDEYLYEVGADYFKPLASRYFVSAHTHVQTLIDFGEKIYCNPGAVGQPRDGDPRASFATFSEGVFKLHRVEYDVNAIISSMKSLGFEDRLYENLRSGTKIGGGVSTVKTSFTIDNNSLE